MSHEERGWPGLLYLHFSFWNVGAPSLRILQGRVTMLPAQDLFPLMRRSVSTLGKMREGRGTHRGADVREIKSVG